MNKTIVVPHAHVAAFVHAVFDALDAGDRARGEPAEDQRKVEWSASCVRIGHMHETLDLLRAFPDRLADAVRDLSDERLRTPEAEGKWSVHDVVAHLADLELVYAVRIRTILSGAAGDAPLPSLAQDAWVANVHRREPLSELLEQFTFDRNRNLTLVQRLNDEELARSGKHPQYGAMTIPMALERMKNHDAKHFAQMERIQKTTAG